MSVIDYGRAGDAVAPSPLIWKDFPMIDHIKKPGETIHIWDDFDSGMAALDAVGNKFPWEVVGTNPDVDVVEDEEHGVVVLSGSNADNDSCYLRSAVLYDLTMNNRQRFWYEARLKFGDADDDMAMVAGLGEAAFMTAEANADDGATIINEDFIGFMAVTDATNMGNLQAVYNQGGAGTTVVDSNVGTFADDTYKRIGMRFDGLKTVTWYVDGAVVATLDIDDLTGNSLANFLGVFQGLKDCAGDATTLMELDWVRFGCGKFPSGI